MSDRVNGQGSDGVGLVSWPSPFEGPSPQAPVCDRCHPLQALHANAAEAAQRSSFQTVSFNALTALQWTSGESPSLDERAEDIAAMRAAEEGYLQSLEGSGRQATTAFDHLLDSAIALTRLREHERRVRDAQKDVRERRQAVDVEWFLLNEPHHAVDVMSCHAGARLSELQLFGASNAYHRLVREQEEAEQRLEQVTAMKDAALVRFEQRIRDAIVRSVPEGQREEVRIPPVALSTIADAMIGLGELEKAVDYKYAASMAEQRVSQRLWYGLDASWLEVLSGRKPASEVIDRIKQVREHLPQLMTESMFYHTGGDPFAQAQDLGRPLPIEDPGRPEDIQHLALKSWGVLYDVMQASLGELEKDDAIEARLAEIRKLEEERQQSVRARTGIVDRYETALHMSNMQRVTTSWTQKGGLLEHTRRSVDQEEAEKLHAELVADVEAMRVMADPFVEEKPGDALYEAFVEMDWQVAFNGRRSLDRPQDGLLELATKVIPTYEGTKTLASLVGELRGEARELGIEEHLFVNGKLNARIDISELPAGLTAGDRTRSSYWTSNNTVREVGLPLVSGGGCGLLAVAAWESGPGAVLIGCGCALVASVANQQYNVRVLGGEAYRQSLATGLTNIDAAESWRQRRTWLTMAGINTAFGGMPFTRSLVGGVGRLLFGGVGRVAGSVSAHYMTAIAERPFLSAVFRAAGGATTDAVGSATAAGRWLAQRPAGDLARIGIGSLYPFDYFFLDKNYQLVWGDGRVDTALGYAGAASFWSAMAYRGFAATWREAAKYPVATWRGGELLPFAEQMAASRLRSGIVRLGADATMADYFLVKHMREKKYFDDHNDPDGSMRALCESNEGKDRSECYQEWHQMVDFAVDRTTARQQRDFDRQFKLDTWLGYGGMLAMGGDWAIHEWRSLPMYIESSTPFPWRAVARRPWTLPSEAWNMSSVAQARVRIGVGNSLVGYDLAQNGKLDVWYLGGIGGSLLMNEAGHIMLEVDAMGSMVATGFRLGTEWLMQWQQDIPIRAPDATRLMWASGESAIMRFPPKMYVMGHHYLKSFPLGRRLRAFHNWMSAPQRGYLTQYLASKVRSIESFGGAPRLMQGQNGWRPKLIKPNVHKSIQLTLDAEGQPLPKPVRFRVLHQQRRWASNSSRETRVAFGKEEMTYEELAMSESHKSLLKANGYFLKEGNLWQMQPWYIGQVRNNGRTINARELETMTAAERAETERLLADEGIYYKTFAKMKRNDPALFERVKAHLIAEKAWHDDLKGALLQRWYTDPSHPRILSSHGNYGGSHKSNGTYKVTALPFRRGLAAKVNGPGEEIWVHLNREFRPVAAAEVGGWKATMFKGPLNQPRLRCGIPLQAGAMTVTAILANYGIFRRTMDGDPQYQMMQRGFNYGFSELVTHPFVQWPLGYDTAKAQFVGRTIGIFVNMAGNELFPTYLNTWPGLPTYYNRLDGVPDHPIGKFMEEHVAAIVNGRPRWEPLDTWANTMSSSQVMPFGIWGKADDTIAHFEERGISTFRDAEACIRAVVDGEALLQNRYCQDLPLKTQDALLGALKLWETRREVRGVSGMDQIRERNQKLADNFVAWMERERKGTLTEMERRTLITMAAHIKETNREMMLATNPDMFTAYEPWRVLEKRYNAVLFDRIPRMRNDHDWSDFINHVNRNRSSASDFYFDLHNGTNGDAR